MILPPRNVSDSFTEMTELVLPSHANALGTAFGGTVMAWVDICGAITSQRHCQRIAVTAAIDELVFLSPIRVGDVVCLAGRVNAAFRTSLEVQVTVEVEDRETQERRACVTALLTFVPVGSNGKPTPVPPLSFANEDERARAASAETRRAERLRRKSIA